MPRDPDPGIGRSTHDNSSQTVRKFHNNHNGVDSTRLGPLTLFAC